MSRFIAALLLVIPVGLAAIGVKILRDSLFDILNSPFPWIWLQFVVGLIFFLIGVGFIGGWIAFRDRKRNYNYKLLREKERQKQSQKQ